MFANNVSYLVHSARAQLIIALNARLITYYTILLVCSTVLRNTSPITQLDNVYWSVWYAQKVLLWILLVMGVFQMNLNVQKA